MADSRVRAHLRRELEAHLTRLGYSSVRLAQAGELTPEIVRVSPMRGRVAYGETVLRADLRLKRCHERLLFFSQRRTRHRSSILFFIGVTPADQQALEKLLEELDIRSGIRGGHVHVIPIAAAAREPRRAPARRAGRA